MSRAARATLVGERRWGARPDRVSGAASRISVRPQRRNAPPSRIPCSPVLRHASSTEIQRGAMRADQPRRPRQGLPAFPRGSQAEPPANSPWKPPRAEFPCVLDGRPQRGERGLQHEREWAKDEVFPTALRGEVRNRADRHREARTHAPAEQAAWRRCAPDERLRGRADDQRCDQIDEGRDCTLRCARAMDSSAFSPPRQRVSRRMGGERGLEDRGPANQIARQTGCTPAPC